MTTNEITSVINNIIANGNTAMVQISTEPKMNKRNNHLYGRVKKQTAYIGINFRNYTEVVNERRATEGNTADFQAKASIYNRINDYLVEKDGQVYLRLIFDKNIVIKSFFEVDGNVATDSEVEVIKTFLPTRKSNASYQGLSEENEVQVRNIKIENVVAIGNENETHEIA